MMIHHGLLEGRPDTTPRCRTCRERIEKDGVSLNIKTPWGKTPITEAQVWCCRKCRTMRILKAGE
jgi:hypothetical protein